MGEATGDRIGVYVGNSNYADPGWGTLPGAASDAAAMQSAQSATWPGEVQTDLTGAGLRKALLDPVGALEPGDGMLFTYAGHGDGRGQLGIDAASSPSDDQILPSSVIGAAANAARAKGAQFVAVIDSCHAGGAVEATREDRAQELEGEDLGAQGEALLEVLQSLESARDVIVDGDPPPADAAAAPAGRGMRVTPIRPGGTGGATLYPTLEGCVSRYEALTRLTDLRAELRVDAAGWSRLYEGDREDIVNAMARVVLARAEASRPE